MHRSLIAPFLGLALILDGCATTGDGRQSAMNQAIQKCVASVALGAILGAGLGALAGGGGKHAAIGAAGGAAVGGIACAVMVKLAKDDQQKISVLEEQAVAKNRSETQTFKAQNGSTVTLHTKVQEASPPPSEVRNQPKYTQCRYTDKTITMDGQSAQVEPQLWCRLESGDWKPVPT